VTHPEVRRFFMTIPEAVQLVLQAALLGQNGDLFMLDMGDSVKIIDLARDLIRLSGLTPDRDIDIIFTGLRPGEKLDEELYQSDENHTPTSHRKILKVTREFEQPQELLYAIDTLYRLVMMARIDDALALIASLTPEYSPPANITPRSPSELDPGKPQSVVPLNARWY